MVRLVILLTLLAGLALFALQNAAPPPIALVFLGVRSPAFPVSVWLLAAFALGVASSFLLRGLFELYSYSSRPSAPRRGSTERSPNVPIYPPENPVIRETVAPPRGSTERSPNVAETPRYTTPEVKTVIQPPQPSVTSPRSDWDTPTRQTQEWDSNRIPPNLNKSPTPQASVNTTPQTSVGKTDSIYDVNYRVITPPYRGETPPTPTPPASDWKKTTDDDEDWV